jgi:hypothetical protein
MKVNYREYAFPHIAVGSTYIVGMYYDYKGGFFTRYPAKMLIFKIIRKLGKAPELKALESSKIDLFLENQDLIRMSENPMKEESPFDFIEPFLILPDKLGKSNVFCLNDLDLEPVKIEQKIHSERSYFNRYSNNKREYAPGNTQVSWGGISYGDDLDENAITFR